MTEDLLLTDKTEMGEIIDKLNDDSPDPKTGMSNIDFHSRLQQKHLIAVTIIEELKRLGILPKKVTLSHQFKRNTVSLNAQGRREVVAMQSAKRESDMGSSFVDKVKGLFGGNNQSQI